MSSDPVMLDGFDQYLYPPEGYSREDMGASVKYLYRMLLSERDRRLSAPERTRIAKATLIAMIIGFEQ